MSDKPDICTHKLYFVHMKNSLDLYELEFPIMITYNLIGINQYSKKIWLLYEAVFEQDNFKRETEKEKETRERQNEV